MYGYQSVTINSGEAAGSNGSATANNTSSHIVTGQICSIGVTYGDSPPGTTDVTIATAGNNGPALTILTLTNATPMAGSIQGTLSIATLAQTLNMQMVILCMIRSVSLITSKSRLLGLITQTQQK